MTESDYELLIKDKTPKEPRFKNSIVSFLVGGFLGLLCELLSKIWIFLFNIDINQSYSINCILLIMVASICTCLSFFDDLVAKTGHGLIIPTTGFAHSMTSSAIEFRKEGMITGIGANLFKLAGSVILYGIVSAFYLSIIWVIING